MVISWRYIKTISGVGVCRALVTIPTLLIMFCKMARRKKMKKLWSENRNEKMKETGRQRHFYGEVADEMSRHRSNSIRGGS